MVHWKELYPNSNHSFKQRVVPEYMEFTIKYFSKYFPNYDSLVSYMERLTNVNDAEDLIETGVSLYNIQNQTDTSARFLLLISEIEKLITSEFSGVDAWLKSHDQDLDKSLSTIREKIKIMKDDNNSLKKILIDDLTSVYSSKYGIAKGFADFVEKFVSKDDQLKLIMGMQFAKDEVPIKYSSRNQWQPKVDSIEELRKEGIEVSPANVPKCYDWKLCETGYGNCHPEVGCKIQEDIELFQTTIRSIAKIIYSARSEIVHAGSKKHLLTDNGASYSVSYIMINDKVVAITLTIDEIQRIFSDAIMNFFDSKISK